MAAHAHCTQYWKFIKYFPPKLLHLSNVPIHHHSRLWYTGSFAILWAAFGMFGSVSCLGNMSYIPPHFVHAHAISLALLDFVIVQVHFIKFLKSVLLLLRITNGNIVKRREYQLHMVFFILCRLLCVVWLVYIVIICVLVCLWIATLSAYTIVINIACLWVAKRKP